MTEKRYIVKAEGVFMTGLSFGFERLGRVFGEMREEGTFGTQSGGFAGSKGGDAFLLCDCCELGRNVDGS